MPERTEHAPGTPSWIDLMSPDVAASQEFYGSLFGWTFDSQDTNDPDSPYVMARLRGRAAAGLMRLPADLAAAGVPPVWTTYVTVVDVDLAASKVNDLGGGVNMGPIDVMTAGRMATVSDPQGAVFCLWQPRDSIGAEVVNEPVSLTWTELMTPDPAAARDFYGGLFGWTAESAPMGEGVEYTVFSLGDRAIAGAMAPPAEGMPPFWGVYFSVADTDATVEAAKGLGATVLAEPVDVPEVGRMAALLEPNGAAFSVLKNAGQVD